MPSANGGGEGPLEGNKVSLDRLDGLARNRRSTVLVDRRDADGLPINWRLTALEVETESWRRLITSAAAKISLTDLETSGPIPSPSMRLTVYFPYQETVGLAHTLPVDPVGTGGATASAQAQ